MKVIKRDGKEQDFDNIKIIEAIQKAGLDFDKATDVADKVVSSLKGLKVTNVNIETIQDLVEKKLMSDGYYDIAKGYILYRQERAKLRTLKSSIDENAISDYIHYSKYSRYIEEKQRRESWEETIDRREAMDIRKFPFLKDEIVANYKLVREKKVIPSARSLQFAGRAMELENLRGYNCSFGHASRWQFFGELFYLLLAGCGVGYSVQDRHISQLPVVATIDTAKVIYFTIQDSIAGWADAVKFLVSTYLSSEDVAGTYAEFDYSEVRRKGLPLKTSGGKAPGHIPLKIMLERIRMILDKAQGRKLYSVEIHDICCHIAEAVLAGGIRRSSLICLFDNDDQRMLTCKMGDWIKENQQRRMANNSAVFLRSNGEKDKDKFLDLFTYMKDYGEPGFFFTEDLDYGCNPCGEILLNPIHPTTKESGWQLCNLTEINGKKVKSKADLIAAAKAAAFIGTLQASYTYFPYLGKTTEEICRYEALIGVGITGIQNSDVCRVPVCQREAAKAVVAENIRVAKLIGINPASRCTTVKPSGTLSQLLDCGSGIHGDEAHIFIRRITANKLEPIYQYFKSVNPHMCQDSVYNKVDAVIEFPVARDKSTRTKDSYTTKEFMDCVYSTFKNWVLPGSKHENNRIDGAHNVSCTVTVKDGEWAEIAEYAWSKRAYTNAMAFFSDTGSSRYPQAPREAIVDEAGQAYWNKLVQGYKPVNYLEMIETEDNVVPNALAACEGDRCILKIA